MGERHHGEGDRERVGADDCPVDNDVPACDVGPAGRVGFVLRELRNLLRRSR